MIKYVLQEAEILKSLNHENVIGYRHAYYEKKTKMFYLLLEYASGGDLDGLYKKRLKIGSEKMYMKEQRVLKILR